MKKDETKISDPKVVINDDVAAAIGDIQEDHNAYARYLEELNGWILDHSGSSDDRDTIAQLNTVHIMRKLIRQLSGEK